MSFTPMPSFGKGRNTFLFTPESSTPKLGFADLMLSNDSNNGHSQVDSHKLESLGTNELLTDIATKIGLSISESMATCIGSCLSCRN